MADVFRRSGEAYLRDHVLRPEQRKALRSIVRCRTPALGGHVDECNTCDYKTVSYNSCRNRSCSKCQSLSQTKWIEARMPRIIPTSYFHVVMTLPAELRPVAIRNQEIVYGLLFASASKTLLELGWDSKRLGGQIGLTAVLHTWTRALEFHPHVHSIVTGGGLSADGSRWIASKGGPRYLFPIKVISQLFRGKFLDGLARLYNAGELNLGGNSLADPATFQALKNRLYTDPEWVVYAKPPFGGPEQVFNYLGRYTHRVGISNYRILSIDDGKVTFATKDGETLTLSDEEFIRRFLQHVLPPGFTKIRHYGLMASSNVTTKLETARKLLGGEPPTVAPQGETWTEFLTRLTGEDVTKCPKCSGQLQRRRLTSSELHALRLSAPATNLPEPHT